jgi:ABC-2 type transport system ATP-binding protein
VLLTTHYMDEAERLCDRVAVVDHGKVIALGSPRELIAGLGGEHVVEFTLVATDIAERPGVRGPAGPGAAFFEDLPSVRAVRHEADGYVLSVSEPHVALPALLARLREGGHELASLTTRHGSLEDVFVSLTGRHLREGEGTP